MYKWVGVIPFSMFTTNDVPDAVRGLENTGFKVQSITLRDGGFDIRAAIVADEKIEGTYGLYSNLTTESCGELSPADRLREYHTLGVLVELFGDHNPAESLLQKITAHVCSTAVTKGQYAAVFELSSIGAPGQGGVLARLYKALGEADSVGRIDKELANKLADDWEKIVG